MGGKNTNAISQWVKEKVERARADGARLYNLSTQPTIKHLGVFRHRHTQPEVDVCMSVCVLKQEIHTPHPSCSLKCCFGLTERRSGPPHQIFISQKLLSLK